MSDAPIISAEDMDAARLSQVAELRDYLAAALPMIAAIRTSDLGGRQLWMGGLPQPLSQTEAQVNHCVQALTTSFPIQ